MDHDERMEFNQCLNQMLALFARVAKVSEHTKEIEAYLYKHDRAKEMLSNLASDDHVSGD